LVLERQRTTRGLVTRFGTFVNARGTTVSTCPARFKRPAVCFCSPSTARCSGTVYVSVLTAGVVHGTVAVLTYHPA
jgi:hypothetical protein